jgi:hypothetical protein
MKGGQGAKLLDGVQPEHLELEGEARADQLASTGYLHTAVVVEVLRAV